MSIAGICIFQFLSAPPLLRNLFFFTSPFGIFIKIFPPPWKSDINLSLSWKFPVVLIPFPGNPKQTQPPSPGNSKVQWPLLKIPRSPKRGGGHITIGIAHCILQTICTLYFPEEQKMFINYGIVFYGIINFIFAVEHLNFEVVMQISFFSVCLVLFFIYRMIYGFTCSGILETQYKALTEAALLGVTGEKTIRKGNFCIILISCFFLHILNSTCDFHTFLHFYYLYYALFRQFYFAE